MSTVSGTASKGVNLRKIERMAVLAFRNALRLHEDAIRLFTLRSYPSAYALSVFAAEEIGKFILLEHVVWNTRVNGRGTAEDEHAWLKLMLDHRVKQSHFAGHAEVSTFGKPIVRRIWSGELERKKHRALYVGLPTIERKKINLRGRILAPHTVSRSAAEEQITLVNDFIVTFATGVACEAMITDLASMKSVLTLRLVNRLIRRWSRMGRPAWRYLARLKRAVPRS